MKWFKAFTLLAVMCSALAFTACSDVGMTVDGYDDTADTVVFMDTDDDFRGDTDGFDDDIDDVLPIPDAGDGEDPDCELGTESCPCYTDLTCDDGHYCVETGQGFLCRPVDTPDCAPA